MADDVSKERFMEDVQKYECIYNKNSCDYKDKYKKLNAWTKIGENFKLTPHEVEKNV